MGLGFKKGHFLSAEDSLEHMANENHWEHSIALISDQYTKIWLNANARLSGLGKSRLQLGFISNLIWAF